MHKNVQEQQAFWLAIHNKGSMRSILILFRRQFIGCAPDGDAHITVGTVWRSIDITCPTFPTILLLSSSSLSNMNFTIIISCKIQKPARVS